MKKTAFTLAEVLITLGVIGVVAAMTMPSVINKYRAKTLETAFKKSYSNVSNAILKTKLELSSDNLLKDYVVFDRSKGGYYLSSELRNAFFNQLEQTSIYKGDEYKNLKNYNNSAVCGDSVGWCPKPIHILKDGSSVDIQMISYQIFIGVDINGPYKKPNRYGHDVFSFVINSRVNDKIVLTKQAKLYTEDELKDMAYPFMEGNPCSIKSNQSANGVGCAWYAFNNVNPDDSTKTYWDNLPK